jgi:hypothetical protein
MDKKKINNLIQCRCGSIHSYQNTMAHEKSKKHRRWSDMVEKRNTFDMQRLCDVINEYNDIAIKNNIKVIIDEGYKLNNSIL